MIYLSRLLFCPEGFSRRWRRPCSLYAFAFVGPGPRARPLSGSKQTGLAPPSRQGYGDRGFGITIANSSLGFSPPPTPKGSRRTLKFQAGRPPSPRLARHMRANCLSLSCVLFPCQVCSVCPGCVVWSSGSAPPAAVERPNVIRLPAGGWKTNGNLCSHLLSHHGLQCHCRCGACVNCAMYHLGSVCACTSRRHPSVPIG